METGNATWQTGDYGDFLGLSDEERRIVQSRAERARLESEVIKATIEEYEMEHAADHGSSTITRIEALIKTQRAMKTKREAVKALLEFESPSPRDTGRN